MLSIKKNDTVFVLSGKDKGKTGRVLRVFPHKKRAIVEGINLVKKHLRRRSENDPGGITSVPAPMHISNIALYCSNCKRGVRFGVKLLKGKEKIRVCKRCQNPL